MLTHQEIEIAAAALRQVPRKSFLQALASRLNLASPAHLLLTYVQQGGQDWTLGHYHLYPQSTDYQVAKLILTQNHDLRQQLSEVSVFWPNKYIAALWHCSPHWVEVARLVFQIHTTDSGIRPKLQEEVAWTNRLRFEHMNLIYKACSNPRLTSWEQVGYELGLTPTFFRPYAREYGIVQDLDSPSIYPPIESIPEILEKRGRFASESELKLLHEEFCRVGSITAFAEKYKLSRTRARYAAARCAWSQDRIDRRRFNYEVILRDRDVSGMNLRQVWDNIILPVTEQSYHSRRLTQVKKALESLGWVQVLEGKHCFQWFRSTQ